MHRTQWSAWATNSRNERRHHLSPVRPERETSCHRRIQGSEFSFAYKQLRTIKSLFDRVSEQMRGCVRDGNASKGGFERSQESNGLKFTHGTMQINLKTKIEISLARPQASHRRTSRWSSIRAAINRVCSFFSNCCQIANSVDEGDKLNRRDADAKRTSTLDGGIAIDAIGADAAATKRSNRSERTRRHRSELIGWAWKRCLLRVS